MAKTDDPMMAELRIASSVGAPAGGVGSGESADRRIRAFLDGKSHGEDVLGALYGAVADEPVPKRLRRLVKP